MKTLKILLTILLTLVLVVVGFATEILAAADLSVFNPWFYETALNQMGFYESIRVILLEKIDYSIQQKQSIPEKFKADAYVLAENVFSEAEFSRQIGEFLGSSLDYVITGEGDAAIPVYEWTQDLNEEIDKSTLIDDIINYEIDIKEIDEADKDKYYTPYKTLLMSAYTGYMGMIGSILASTENLSDVIKIFAPTKELQEKIEGRLWVLRYWLKRANLAAYIGLAFMLIMAGLLFVVWKKNIGVALKLIGILLIVNSAIFILIGIGLLLGITIGGLLNVIPSSILPYINIIQSLSNPMAMVITGAGMILLAVGIILTVIGSAFLRKKRQEKLQAETMETQTPEISEIDYTSNSDTDNLELISEDVSEKEENTDDNN